MLILNIDRTKLCSIFQLLFTFSFYVFLMIVISLFFVETLLISSLLARVRLSGIRLNIKIECNFRIFVKMYGEGASIYDRQKQQAKQVLSKIRNKHYQQIQSQRQEGLSIVDDLKDELRRNFKRVKTQKIYKRIRQREMTYQFRKSLVEAKSKEGDKNYSQMSRTSGRKSIVLSQSSYFPSASRLSKRLSTINKTHINDVLKQIASELKPDQKEMNSEQNSQSQSSADQEINKSAEINPSLISLNYSQCKSFLPMLNLYIQQRLFLKTMTSNQKKIQSTITQMLLLALARGKNNKLLDALDILIDIEKYFPKKSVHMKQLKACWYLAIGKLFVQLKKEDKQRQKVNRWQRQTKSMSMKSLLNSKRQKTIIIRSIASKRNFMNRIFIQMKKMDLVFETTYQQQLRKKDNHIKENQSEKIIIAKFNKTHLLGFPQPHVLFGSTQVVNYSVIVLQRDKETNLFPTFYPKSLSQIFPKNQYTITLCKINSVLVPENRCFNYETSLYSYFESIFCIFLVFLLTVVLAIYLLKKLSQYGFIATLIFSICGILFLSMRIHGKSSDNIGKTNQIYSSIVRILDQCSDKYEYNNLRCTLSQNADVIILSCPRQAQQLQHFTSQNISSQNFSARNQRLNSISTDGYQMQIGNACSSDRFDEVIEKDSSQDSSEDDSAQSQSEPQYYKQQANINYIEEYQKGNLILSNPINKQNILGENNDRKSEQQQQIHSNLLESI